jgi:hypothetical protein
MVADLVKVDPRDTLGFYVGVKHGELADLEIVAAAAIAWSQSIKAAAAALYPDEQIRVSLIAAEPGSSRWLAKVEQSSANKLAEGAKNKWRATPAIVQLTIGLAVAWPTTILPSINYYKDQFRDAAKALGIGEDEAELAKLAADKARAEPAVEAAHRQVFRTLQRDPKITGVASGIPTGKGWRPPLIPSDQFAEADGLFRPAEPAPHERIFSRTLEVFLVSPQLENAPKTWKFRQEGLPPFGAVMRDKTFLAALERNAVRESIRTKIPMTILLEVKQRFVEGEWKDVPRTRSVAKVIAPKIR